MREEREDIKSLLLPELQEALAGMGEPSYRASQVFRWLHSGAVSFSEMTDIPIKLREELGRRFFITVPEIARKQVSRRDGTTKYLWKLSDGNAVESVLMSYRHGNTVCISTQVGCRMGCRFCASTIGGLVRNLRPSEMLDQVLFSQKDSGCAVSHVVLMGIGEPLDNYDAVLRFLRLVSDPRGMNISLRHVSLSTCGLVEKVDKLAGDKLQLTLSVSLHAPDDETRSKIMPVNRSCGVDRLLEACRDYFGRTGRRISFEYAMIDKVNDTAYHARLLAEKLRGMPCHVNLILLNPVPESALKPSRPESVRAFVRILKENGVNVTVRRRLGGDIEASCGQLRRSASQ